jgi:hypothetical protein
MGLALDEPKAGDASYEIDEIPLIVDPFAMKLIKESGGLSIKSSMFGPVAELQGREASGCGCS